MRQAEDTECLHDLRVAARRLRSLLPLFAACLSRQTCDRWRKHLRRLSRALGEARDTDVQIACVQHFVEQEARPEERPGAERLLLRLQQQRQALQASVIAALDRFVDSQLSADMTQTLTQVAAANQWSAGSLPGRSVYRQLRKALRTRLRALLAYAPYVHRPECHAELHAMRIAAKRLRYTMQAYASLYSDALEEPIRAARTLQTLLGDIHDCDVWAQELPLFLEAERLRTLVYFGEEAPFTALVPGVLALQHNRQQYRIQRYQEFVAFWQQTQAQGVWERLQQTLQAAAQRRASPEPSGAAHAQTPSAPAAAAAQEETSVDQC